MNGKDRHPKFNYKARDTRPIVALAISSPLTSVVGQSAVLSFSRGGFASSTSAVPANLSCEWD